MARPGMSDARKEAAALTASRRMVSQGERPGYRVAQGLDGRWAVENAPWLPVDAASRYEALAAARAAIAAWLEVDPDSFDVD